MGLASERNQLVTFPATLLAVMRIELKNATSLSLVFLMPSAHRLTIPYLSRAF